VAETGLSIAAVTKKAGYKRGSFYLHVKKEDLSADILKKYGNAIGHDFSKEIPGLKQLVEDEPADFTNEPTLEEAIKERNMWREKYYELVDKYLKLIDPEKNNQP
jgi:AcrR family transcriptional regulator